MNTRTPSTAIPETASAAPAETRTSKLQKASRRQVRAQRQQVKASTNAVSALQGAAEQVETTRRYREHRRCWWSDLRSYRLAARRVGATKRPGVSHTATSAQSDAVREIRERSTDQQNTAQRSSLWYHIDKLEQGSNHVPWVSGVDVVETRENAQWWDTKDRVKVRTVGEILEKDGRAVAYMYRDATTHDRELAKYLAYRINEQEASPGDDAAPGKSVVGRMCRAVQSYSQEELLEIQAMERAISRSEVPPQATRMYAADGGTPHEIIAWSWSTGLFTVTGGSMEETTFCADTDFTPDEIPGLIDELKQIQAELAPLVTSPSKRGRQ